MVAKSGNLYGKLDFSSGGASIHCVGLDMPIEVDLDQCAHVSLFDLQLIYIMCSCIYFLLFILIPMSFLSHIYSLSWLDVSNSGLEKDLKHWPNLVELK